MAKVNRIVAIVFLVISLGFIYLGRKLSEGAKAYPMVLAGMLVILSIMLFINASSKLKSDTSKNPLLILKKESKYFLILIIGYVLFILGLEILGFVLSSLLFIIAIQYLLGYKDIMKLLLNSTLFTVVIYLSFSKVLNVPLPEGIFSAFL
jgi:putative tricarboxylic transport membrane protein